MILNRLEYLLMNNPIRSALQRHVEARRLVRLGGVTAGGRALEVGCGRGVGVELILDMFHADAVDAFDLDPRMVKKARERLSGYASRVRLWVGDATAISAPDATYDAVFDFGIIHHVSDWPRAVEEISRVLKPDGCFYGEEVLAKCLNGPLVRRLFEHPRQNRFDALEFARQLDESGLDLTGSSELWGWLAWFTARKRAA